MTRIALLLCCTLLPVSPAPSAYAQRGGVPAISVTLRELDNPSRTALERAAELLADGQAAEAIDNVRQVMESGDALVRLPAAFADEGYRRYVPARDYCRRWFARLGSEHPEALALYRRQTDAVAGAWLQQALQQRDDARLLQIAERYFASSAGDEALYWYGEYALERGDLRRAREAWERISPRFRFGGVERLDFLSGFPWHLVLRDVQLENHPDAVTRWLARHPNSWDWLAYPDSDLDLAAVQARLVLVSILEGDRRRAAKELELFIRTAGDASGWLAGRQGNYAELLRQLLETPGTALAPACARESWPTFAGAPQRHGRACGPLAPGGAPLWRAPLPRVELVEEDRSETRLRVGESAGGLLSYHPIVVGDTVLLATGSQADDVLGWTLSGDARFGEAASDVRRVVLSREPPPRVRRYTLSADDALVYHLVTGGPDAPRIVALERNADLRRRFEVVLAGDAWQGAWELEGAPLVWQGRLFVALRRTDQIRPECHVACFDTQAGRLVWSQFVCAAEQEAFSAPHTHSHNLLTVHEGTLYYNTNAGAVVSLESRDGRINWLVAYPRRDPRGADPDRNDLVRFRDRNPCLVHRGMVITAPRDSDALFALDTASGRLLWQTAPEVAADAVHLLGVGDGRLLVGGEALYWLDVERGTLTARFPSGFKAAPGHVRPEPRGFGRGLLAGGRIYWPTRDAIYVFEQRTITTDFGGRPQVVERLDLRKRGARGGNLIAAGGLLLVASSDELYAFSAYTASDPSASGAQP